MYYHFPGGPKGEDIFASIVLGIIIGGPKLALLGIIIYEALR